MKASLDEIFEKIFISEQEAQSLKTSLQEVKTRICSEEACVKELDEEISSLKGQMLFQMQKLSEKEVMARMLRTKESILRKRKEEIRTEKEKCEKFLADLDKELQTSVQSFCAEAAAFTSKFSFKDFDDQKQTKKQVQQRMPLRLVYPRMVWSNEDSHCPDDQREADVQNEVYTMDDDEEMWENSSSVNIVVDDAEFQRIKEEFENCDEECFIDALSDVEL